MNTLVAEARRPGSIKNRRTARVITQ
jgi:hypothetical protein